MNASKFTEAQIAIVLKSPCPSLRLRTNHDGNPGLSEDLK
jgi:hypothetical protein